MNMEPGFKSLCISLIVNENQEVRVYIDQGDRNIMTAG